MRAPDAILVLMSTHNQWVFPSKPRLKRIPKKRGREGGKEEWALRVESLAWSVPSPWSWALGGSNRKTWTVQGILQSKGPGSPLMDSEEVPRLRVDLGEEVLGRLLAWHSLACGLDRRPCNSFFLFIYLAVSVCAAAHGLCCRTGATTSCWVWVSHCRLLLLWGTGSWACWLQYLAARGSVVTTRGFSCPAACGIFPN